MEVARFHLFWGYISCPQKLEPHMLSLTGFLPTAQDLVVLLCQFEGIMGQISKPLAQAQ